MNCFITGASGFIGRNLCTALQLQGDTVIAGLRSTQDGPWDRTVLFDLENINLKPDDLKDISCVFHLAGKVHALSETRHEEHIYHMLNTEGTRRLLELSREANVRRFVFASSVKVMGEGGAESLDENTVCLPVSPYGSSKLEAERLVIEGGYVPEPVVLRLTMVYGPTRKGNLPRMINAVAKGHFPAVPEVGNRRSMIHVDDVVRAMLLVAEKFEAVGNIYIITDGKVYSTRQIYDWICAALGKPIPRWVIPLCIFRAFGEVGDAIGKLRGKRFIFDSDTLDKLVGSAVYSSEKIVRELDFYPRKDLRSAIPEIVAYLKLS